VYARVHLAGGKPHVERTERYVVVDCGHEQLVIGVLEHEADLRPDASQGVVASTTPFTDTAPLAARRMPFVCNISVDLPAPLGPSSATRCPGSMARSTPLSAVVPSGYANDTSTRCNASVPFQS